MSFEITRKSQFVLCFGMLSLILPHRLSRATLFICVSPFVAGFCLVQWTVSILIYSVCFFLLAVHRIGSDIIRESPVWFLQNYISCKYQGANYLLGAARWTRMKFVFEKISIRNVSFFEGVKVIRFLLSIQKKKTTRQNVSNVKEEKNDQNKKNEGTVEV